MANKHFVTKCGNIEDESTGKAYEIFAFRTVSGAARQLRVPRARSRDAWFIYKELLTLNAELPLLQASCLFEVQRAIDTEVSARLIYAQALGWRNHHRAFTLADAVIGGERRKRQVVPPEWANQSEATGLKSRGTLTGWSETVGKPASTSDSLVLAIAACFAAPLLKILDRANFGLNLFGLAPAQQALTLGVTASVLGMNATSLCDTVPALQEARAFNDLLLIVREGEHTGSAASYRQRGRSIKALLIGHEGHLPKAQALEWRGIFLTTPPHSNEQLAVSVDAARTGDERAAWIDVPPESDSGPTDQAPKQTAGQANERLITASRAEQGTPLLAYIKFLIDRRTTLRSMIEKHCAAFIAVAENDDLAIAQNFALLYAAGCLAIKAGILPWKRQRLLEALQRQLAAVVGHARSFHITPRTIRRILRRRLRSPAVVQRILGASFGPAEHAGFWRWEGIDMVFTIHTTAFRGWFADAAHCRAALRWLHKAGLLVLRKRHALPSTKSTEWAERTPRWPDGSVQRSFVFTVTKSMLRYLELPRDRRGRILKPRMKPVPLFPGPPLPPSQSVALQRKAKARAASARARESAKAIAREAEEEYVAKHPNAHFSSTYVSGGPPPWRDD